MTLSDGKVGENAPLAGHDTNVIYQHVQALLLPAKLAGERVQRGQATQIAGGRPPSPWLPILGRLSRKNKAMYGAEYGGRRNRPSMPPGLAAAAASSDLPHTARLDDTEGAR